MSSGYWVHAAQVFAEVVREHGPRKAILWSAAASTSFDELDRCSNQLARVFLAHGVAKRDTVCLCLEKTLLAYGAMLACLKIGAVYFVVDPWNPAARTRTMVACCRPRLALIGARVPAGAFECTTLVADEISGQYPLADVDDGPVAPAWTIDGSDPAYVMFTSGSTGVPKGVTISHNNLVNFIRWSQAELGTRPSDVFTNVNPLFFDNSVFDVYGSLFAGAALVPFTAAMMKRPQDVLARIDAMGCTVYFSVPSLLVYFQTLKLVDGQAFRPLRVMVFGGEGYPKRMLARLHESIGSRVELLNVYGPTECTCICSVYRITAEDFRDLRGYPPLGSVIPNFSHLIVDDAGRPVADGETGELCLGGPCVGLGYYDDPGQTSQVFVQNPTHDRFFDRVYKTGDLVRRDPADGKIHFVGRADMQIKHQGYRIELGEIEHALTAIDGVDEAAVVHVTSGGTSRIVAVTASKRDLDASVIRAEAAAALPRYMLPERVVVVTALMKNANGKIDRSGIASAILRGEL